MSIVILRTSWTVLTEPYAKKCAEDNSRSYWIKRGQHSGNTCKLRSIPLSGGRHFYNYGMEDDDKKQSDCGPFGQLIFSPRFLHKQDLSMCRGHLNAGTGVQNKGWQTHQCSCQWLVIIGCRAPTGLWIQSKVFFFVSIWKKELTLIQLIRGELVGTPPDNPQFDKLVPSSLPPYLSLVSCLLYPSILSPYLRSVSCLGLGLTKGCQCFCQWLVCQY